MESMEDVDEFLQKIENKYSLNRNVTPKNDFEKQLFILSEEFDTLGLPTIDLKQSESKLLQQIACNTLLLIQMHRKTLSHITKMDISSQYKDTKNHDMEKTILNLKTILTHSENQNRKLERNITKLNSERSELKKVISMHNQETDKIKHFFKSNQNELNHKINILKNENHHLKEICGHDIDKYFSKEDKFLKVIKNYKQNEEVYKGALQKLEENNVEIMNEILNLRTELALAYSKKE